MATAAPSKLPLWPVAAAVVLYLYWAYFYKREHYQDETIGSYIFAIKDGLWPNLDALHKVGVTITEYTTTSKQDAFDKAASDDKAVGVKVDATGSGVVYKVLRASHPDQKYFRNYIQFYTRVGPAVGGVYVKMPKPSAS
jgi:hypothetical protein